ncbi:MAG: peptidoglycan DD-metalloendopeptidase family protein [Neisseria sp.]|nr:peptidoglycan DD-metalloendopeptidase family protein [Neisseria sp.]
MQISRKPLVLGMILSSLLAACGTWTQPAAPVEQANPYGSNADPYGAPPQDNAPYAPPTTTGGQPYTPPPNSTYVAPHSTYIPSNAPVDLNASMHTVVYGDTVYNITKRYQISEADFRTWNQLTDNNIRIGQMLIVRGNAASGNVYTPPPASTPTVTTTVTPVTTVTTSPATTVTPAATGNTRETAGIVWMRPTQGAELTRFGGASKGIDYGGQLGQAVYAAADGKVVYSGSGLRGYGNLVIVQHNPTYLTAYGNNQALLVKEGQEVKRGQEIARMGNSDASRVQLHFELRENGKPTDPARFIP